MITRLISPKNIETRKREIEYLIRLHAMRMAPCANVEIAFDDPIFIESHDDVPSYYHVEEEPGVIMNVRSSFIFTNGQVTEGGIRIGVTYQGARLNLKLASLKDIIKHELTHVVVEYHRSTDYDYCFATQGVNQHEDPFFVATAKRYGTDHNREIDLDNHLMG